MRRCLIAAAVVALSLPTLAAAANAQGRFERRDGRFEHHGERFEHHRFHDRFGFDVFVGGPLYYPPPAYYAPPVYYYAPAPPASVYAPQPLPGVVVREGRDAQGNYCREYQSVANVNGQSVPTYGTACQRPDGSWQIVN